MAGIKNRKDTINKAKERSLPPGQVKIAEALKFLMEKKEFNAITTAEIARKAGVTEALIYKYFKDKRGLLYEILADYLFHFISVAQEEVQGISGALNKLRRVIWSHINVYANNRVFARILMLEVRCFSDYYRSKPYKLVKDYSTLFLEILEEGIETGEIRSDISPPLIRQIILGAIEHVCLTGVIFNRDISPDELTEDLYNIIFMGIAVYRA